MTLALPVMSYLPHTAPRREKGTKKKLSFGLWQASRLVGVGSLWRWLAVSGCSEMFMRKPSAPTAVAGVASDQKKETKPKG